MYICLLVSVFLCSMLCYCTFFIPIYYVLSNCYLFCHTLCTIYNCPSRFVYFSFPGLAFASVGLPCTGPSCPSFGQTVLGSFSHLQGGCRVDCLGFLLAFSTGHPPFCFSLRPFFRPCGHSREGSPALFRQNFLCSTSGRSFSHHLTPQTRPFSICRPCFSTFRPCFSVSFSRPVRFCLPRNSEVFSRPALFFFPPTRVFSAVLFVISGFFATRSFLSGLLLGFQAVLAPSLWHLGFVRPFFCSCRASSGFRLAPSLSLPATYFVRGLSRSCFLLPGLLSALLVQAKQTT